MDAERQNWGTYAGTYADHAPVDDYDAFLTKKLAPRISRGPVVTDETIHPMLYPFQRRLTTWALRKGRCALFADCGLGKTFMQLEWARLAAERSLIVAPLAVAQQTVREGRRIDLDVTYARSQEAAAASGITITNYEMVEHFDPTAFGAVVLDESSILKSLDGKTRKLLTSLFSSTPMRLCCTATPAPNDIAEIANHAEFLSILTRPEMLARFFVHDDEGWRLKGHAREPFYRWLASWGMSVNRLGLAESPRAPDALVVAFIGVRQPNECHLVGYLEVHTEPRDARFCYQHAGLAVCKGQ